MIKVAGVRFKTAGKVYYFDPDGLILKIGENVIVETARGMEFGTVTMDVQEVEEERNCCTTEKNNPNCQRGGLSKTSGKY